MLKLVSLLICAFFNHSEGLPSNTNTKFHIVWHGGVEPCDNVENNSLTTDQLVFERFNETVTTLSGAVTLQDDSPNGIKLLVKIEKKILGNWEQFITWEMEDLCKVMEATDRVWTPFVSALNVTGCPIPKNTYTIQNVKMPISDFGGRPIKAVFEGEYTMRFEFYDEDNLLGCIQVENSVEPE